MDARSEVVGGARPSPGCPGDGGGEEGRDRPWGVAWPRLGMRSDASSLSIAWRGDGPGPRKNSRGASRGRPLEAESSSIVQRHDVLRGVVGKPCGRLDDAPK